MDDDDHRIIHGAFVSSISVYREEGTVYAKNEGDALRLRTNRGLLSVWVDDSTDQICLCARRGLNQPSADLERLIDKDYPFVGQRVGWSWWGRNQQGYRDGLMLAFGEESLTPQLILLGEASMIRLLRISE